MLPVRSRSGQPGRRVDAPAQRSPPDHRHRPAGHPSTQGCRPGKAHRPTHSRTRRSRRGAPANRQSSVALRTSPQLGQPGDADPTNWVTGGQRADSICGESGLPARCQEAEGTGTSRRLLFDAGLGMLVNSADLPDTWDRSDPASVPNELMRVSARVNRIDAPQTGTLQLQSAWKPSSSQDGSA